MNVTVKKSKRALEKLNRTFLWIAVIHWILSFFTDHLIFEYVMWDTSNVAQMVKTAMTYGAKAVFLLLLIGMYQGIYLLFKKADRRFLRNTLLYFGLNLLLLLLTWPGIWRMDEFGILNSAVKLLPVFWQNYLTSLFYVFSLMLIPVPSGIIIVQCALISLMVGYIVTFFEKRFGKPGLLTFLPALFFPVLDSNLYPMRMSVYGFMELLLLLLLCEKRAGGLGKKRAEKRMEKNADADMPQEAGHGMPWLFICILAAFVTVWRTEAVYYFILFPILLMILFVKRMDKKQLVKIICTYLICALALFVPQKVGDKLTSGNQYDLTSVVLPLVPLVEKAYGTADCEAALAAIDRVIDVEIAVEGAREGKSGISLFWSRPEFQRTYTDAQYREFKSAYYQLVLKFPQTFLAERWDCFVHSVDLLQDTTELFYAEGVANYDTFRAYPGTTPVSTELRNHAISLLEWRDFGDYQNKKAGYGLIYTGILPICILLAVWAVCLMKRKMQAFFLLSLPLVKVPLIFLTAPSRLFMYYYSLYLIGYFLLFYLLMIMLERIYKRVEAPVKKTLAYAKRNGVRAAFCAAVERVDNKHRDQMSALAAAYEGSREWSGAMDEEKLQQEKENQRKTRFAYEPLISIVVPAYETGEQFLKELLLSVKEQTYANWELLIADAGRTDRVKEIVLPYTREETQKDDAQTEAGGVIRYIRLEENKGISENTNAAIAEAKGDYIALLDHDDVLTLDALFSMVEKINAYGETGEVEAVLAVYSDEDKCDGTLSHFYELHRKPDFNLDLLLSNNYICHFLMVRADLMKELKLRPEFDGAQDYDLVLRIAQKAGALSGAHKGAILHVPKVLYHWRCHEGSTAGNTESKRYAYDAGRRALTAYYKAGGLDGVQVKDSPHLGFYETAYTPDIFAVRKDVAAVCGRVVQNGIVTGGPSLKNIPLFNGLKRGYGGYMHRAALYLDVDAADKRALKLRPDLDVTLEEALARGMKLVYDPNFCVEISGEKG